MIGAGWLNVGSLLFGIIAWVVPIIGLVRKNKLFYSLISMGSCAASICAEVFYINHLVNKNDWSALMDITETLAKVCVFLLIVTIVLNTLLLANHSRKNK